LKRFRGGARERIAELRRDGRIVEIGNEAGQRIPKWSPPGWVLGPICPVDAHGFLGKQPFHL
jgi:hypothetical protein